MMIWEEIGKIEDSRARDGAELELKSPGLSSPKKISTDNTERGVCSVRDEDSLGRRIGHSR